MWENNGTRANASCSRLPTSDLLQTPADDSDRQPTRGPPGVQEECSESATIVPAEPDRQATFSLPQKLRNRPNPAIETPARNRIVPKTFTDGGIPMRLAP